MPAKRPYHEARTYFKDCSGVEIYEGDYFKIYKSIKRGPVVFKNGAFGSIVSGCFVALNTYKNIDIKIVPKEGINHGLNG